MPGIGAPSRAAAGTGRRRAGSGHSPLRHRPQLDAEFVLNIAHRDAEKGRLAEPWRTAPGLEPSLLARLHPQPVRHVFDDAHRHLEILLQNLAQAFRIAAVANQMTGHKMFGVGVDAVAFLLRRLADADQARQVFVEASVVRAIQRHRRLRVGPCAVKQQRQPVMEQVGERQQGGVLMVVHPFAHVFGQVQRQRSVGAEQAEAEDRDVVQRAVGARRHLRQRGGRE